MENSLNNFLACYFFFFDDFKFHGIVLHKLYIKVKSFCDKQRNRINGNENEGAMNEISCFYRAD